MFPQAEQAQAAIESLPHARGGVSSPARMPVCSAASSPRTWGCFCQGALGVCEAVVFPTHVGVFPLCPAHHPLTIRLPHARGGVSNRDFITAPLAQSSPRTWGCFRLAAQSPGNGQVFPTHVGVFPDSPSPCPLLAGLPHARGGVSSATHVLTTTSKSSPRTWGCFWKSSASSQRSRVFPTHVGVFLTLRIWASVSFCLPHARGGVSYACWLLKTAGMSSPRTWGCF